MPCKQLARGPTISCASRLRLRNSSFFFGDASTSQTLKRNTATCNGAQEPEAFEGILGTSSQMQEVFAAIRKVATASAPVLLLGESGTGKEMAAEAIHRRSLRKDGPFIAINCNAIPENLLESELFGHEKGSFTGAHAQRKGLIESAAKGTLFLDEIGELPLSHPGEAPPVSPGANLYARGWQTGNSVPMCESSPQRMPI